MSRRIKKKFLRSRIFGVMQNISHCFADTNPFATPIPHIFYKAKINSGNQYKFILTEPYISFEKKVYKFLAQVEKDNSADSFNRAILGTRPEFDDCETGCIDMLNYYLEQINILEMS